MIGPPSACTVGLLHPGQMGASLGAALRPKVADVLWVQEDRSYETTKRAEWADLVAVRTIADLVARSDLIVSVCPPHAALDVAQQVADELAVAGDTRDGGPVYLDANAVAPSTVLAIGGILDSREVVDGGIIGPPAWKPGQTVLHLSGGRAAELAAFFADTPVEARVVGERLGQASAVKACFALQSKAMPTIWAVIAALAASYDVAEPVQEELARDEVDLDARFGELVQRATAKAWRWEGEMAEAARAAADVGLPHGFSGAAAEVYRRVAAGVDRQATPDPDAWLSALVDAAQAPGALPGTTRLEHDDVGP